MESDTQMPQGDGNYCTAHQPSGAIAHKPHVSKVGDTAKLREHKELTAIHAQHETLPRRNWFGAPECSHSAQNQRSSILYGMAPWTFGFCKPTSKVLRTMKSFLCLKFSMLRVQKDWNLDSICGGSKRSTKSRKSYSSLVLTVTPHSHLQSLSC